MNLAPLRGFLTALLHWPPASIRSVPLQDIVEAYAAYHGHHDTAVFALPPHDFLTQMMQKFPDTKESRRHGTG